MNFKQLRCFHAVAREGGFTAAARVLNVGQPSITTHVKALEQRYGAELFRRLGHKVELTDVGRSLAAITECIFDLETQASELLSAAGGLKVGHLVLGATGPYQIPDMVVAFSEKYPDVELSISIGNSQKILSDLLDLGSDIAVVPQIEEDPRLFSIPFKSIRVIAFVGRDHPWGSRRKIKIEDLTGQKVISREAGSLTRQAFENALEQANVKVEIAFDIGSREAVCELVASGIGVGVVLEDEYRPDDRLTPLTVSNADMDLHFNVVCLRERKDCPLIRAFLSVAEDLIARPGSR